MVKKFLKLTAIIVLIIGCLLAYKHRKFLHNRLTHCHQYHVLKYKLFPQKYDRGNTGMKYYYNEEEWGKRTNPALSPKWWFRASHIGAFSCTGLVDDIDNDGRPEIFYGAAENIYCLDGETGDLIWQFALPLRGKTGGLALILEDVDNDGVKELILGTSMPLPTRVYCLNTKKNAPRRIRWFTNLHGDFVSGGVVSFRNKQNQMRIIIATRDAVYSRGSLNVLDAKGKHICPPIYGVDVCNHRPSIADINNDGYLDMLVGSHNFYGAQYGHRVSAFTVETGKLIWSTPVGFDTGARHFPIVDIDNDGEFEILTEFKILNGRDGKVLFDFTKENEFGMSSLSAVLYDEDREFIDFIGAKQVVDYYSKKIKYQFDSFPKGCPRRFLDLDLDGELDFLTGYLVLSPDPEVRFYLFDAQNGALKETIIKDLDQSARRVMREDLPSQQEVWEFCVCGPTEYNKPGYKEKTLKIKKLDKINRLDFSLADVDGDMYWEALVTFNSVVFCFDLPFKIPEKYRSFRYIRLLDDSLEDRSGFNYDMPQRAFK